jgi:hypothetical protein
MTAAAGAEYGEKMLLLSWPDFSLPSEDQSNAIASSFFPASATAATLPRVSD